MNVYRTKIRPLAGTDFREVRKKAFQLFDGIKQKSKRRTYLRSPYFGKEKIFLDLFWNHFFTSTNPRDRMRRLPYLAPGLDLIRNNRFPPITKINQNETKILYFSISRKIKKDFPQVWYINHGPKVFMHLS